MIVIPIADIAFDDATIRAMGKAFDQACKSLRNFGSAGTVREIIAKRIIDAAKNGERDPARLHDEALKAFGIDDTSMLFVSVGPPAPGSSLRFGHASSVIREGPVSPLAGPLADPFLVRIQTAVRRHLKCQKPPSQTYRLLY